MSTYRNQSRLGGYSKSDPLSKFKVTEKKKMILLKVHSQIGHCDINNAGEETQEKTDLNNAFSIVTG